LLRGFGSSTLPQSACVRIFSAGDAMNEQWKEWEGQTVNRKYHLRQLLGSTDHSAVFLTQLIAPPSRDAVLKFVSADTPGSDARLSLWNHAAQLSHKNLLRVYDSGRCAMDGRNLLYIVAERAEENLGEILPQRALSAEEARDILDSALDVLVFLHAKGLAHGHLKPSNLLATQDCLKLSADNLESLGITTRLFRTQDIYDAPELPAAPRTAKSDVWSLGVTLVEALTQRPPEFPMSQNADPMLPSELPELFRDIVQHSLRRRPEQRWAVAEIAARLNPAPLAAAAVAAASSSPVAAATPSSIPLAPEPAIPLAKPTSTAATPARRPVSAPKSRPSSISDYIIPLLLGTAVFFGLIFALPRLFSYRNSSASTQSAATLVPAPAPKPAKPAGTQGTAAPEDKSTAESAEPEQSIKHADPVAASAPAAPTSLTAEQPDSVFTKSAITMEGRGEVLDQVLPQASAKALATIQGTVRIVVKVEVDPAGNVTDASLDTPGPSCYFSGLAEKAARRWKFSGAEAGGHGVPSGWQIRFEFVSSGVHAYPKQIAP